MVELCQFDTNWSYLGEKGTSIEEMPSLNWPVSKSVEEFSWLTIDEGPSYCGLC